eukprot:g2085.t1
MRQYVGNERANEAKRSIELVTRQVDAVAMRIGTSRRNLLGGGITALLVLIFTLGFTRALLVLSVIVYLFQSGTVFTFMNNIAANGGLQQALKLSGRHLGDDVATRFLVPIAGPRGSNWKYGLGCLFLGILLLMRATGSGGSSASASGSTYASPISSSSYTDADASDTDALQVLQAAYQAGWDDNEANAAFGATDLYKLRNSLTNQRAREREWKRNEAQYEARNGDGGGGGSLFGGSGGFGIGKLISVAVLGNSVWTLGKSPSSGSWDYRAAIQNFQYLPTYRKALMAFLILRVLGLSPI